MQQLKCVLLDDELPGLTYLKLLCEQIPEIEIVKSFNDPLLFIKEQEKLEYDLCICDIEMPGLKGTEVAQLIQSKMILFTTAYKEFAVEAFELNAVDYLTKPLKKERLQVAIEKALLRKEQTTPVTQTIQWQTEKGKAVLQIENILHIQTSAIDSRDKQIIYDNQIIILKNITFEKLKQLLPSNSYCQINKNEMIRLHCVTFFTADQIDTSIEFQNKKMVLSIGNSFKVEFSEKMKNF
jgi:DNA-binding response OmpR family regulator